MGRCTGGLGGGTEASKKTAKAPRTQECESPRAASGCRRVLGAPHLGTPCTLRREESTGRPSVPTRLTKTRKAHREPKATPREWKNSCNPYGCKTFLEVDL